nr:immunoglobulin heavy chain junction region [Macaca mulatta]MOW98661.1 immunoglobulin heavy chain junction region [Macaca mulatta]MOW99020.1 immunoglobulin heavy chain junction region [Macaca mulatta]MOW99082.1 immunoglobulin heavy chain junction region [Macaca mulatta]MOW99185.1 immunoglobulin heavy chain junction region [Macaca mulatta]
CARLGVTPSDFDLW